jgi:CubicO group peptidase (beta-lactamase class C family)
MMKMKLSRWLAAAGAALLLVPILAACGNAPSASPAAGAPTSAPVATAAETSTSVPAPTAVVPAPAAAPSAPAPADLSKVAARPFDRAMQAQLAGYITTVMQREQVPGAAVAIVQDGKVVYQQGFGVREKGKPDPVTPETLMMIGSTGKSMTTSTMAR